MFEIRLGLNEDVSTTGLAALDERRRLGLPDGVRLIVRCDVQRSALVGESVARRHFGSQDIYCSRSVSLSLLAPGDLMARPNSESQYQLAELPSERVRELWDLGE